MVFSNGTSSGSSGNPFIGARKKVMFSLLLGLLSTLLTLIDLLAHDYRGPVQERGMGFRTAPHSPVSVLVNYIVWRTIEGCSGPFFLSFLLNYARR